MKSSLTRLMAVLFAVALGAVACGSDASTTDAAASDTESSDGDAASGDDMDDQMDADVLDPMEDDMNDMEHGDDHGDGDHGEHGDHGGHSHGEPIEVPDSMTVPTVALSAVADPVSGHNLFIDLADFDISVENVSSDPVDGEGHLHLYVDGDRVGRIYNTELHLDGLEPGEHMVMIEVNANNHAPYAVDGETITAMTMISVEGGDTTTLDPAELEGASPTVSVSVTADRKSGWNVVVGLDDATLSADDAGSEPVAGEGHLFATLDGEPLGRFYGTQMHLPDLEPGDHELVVELRHNNTAPYAVDGTVVSDTVTFTQPDEAAAMEAMADDADVTIMATITDGSVETASDRVEVEVGQTVSIMIEADVAEEVHVHGYDLFGDVAPGSPTTIALTADVPGVFEVELEGSGLFLFELQVS